MPTIEEINEVALELGKKMWPDCAQDQMTVQSRPRLEVLREGMDCRIPATEHVHVMRDEINRLREALKACSDDLEVYIEQEYAPLRGYPAYERKRFRDLETVREARELLEHQ